MNLKDKFDNLKIKDKLGSTNVKFKNFIERLKKDKKMQLYVGIAFFIIIVIIAGIIILNNISNKPKEAELKTYTAPENEKIFINGLVVPKDSKVIPIPSSSYNPDIRVSNGQKVSKGDTLFIIKDESAINEIKNIKNQISDLIRQKRTLPNDDPSLVNINSQISSLNSSLSFANSKAYTKYQSPFDGIIYLNNSNPSSPVITVQTEDYVMNGQISEQDLSKIKNDMTANITILPTGDTIKGRISYISERPVDSKGENSQDPSLSFYNVTLALDTQDGIVDGYHLQASIEVNADKHRIPTSAIVNTGDEVYIFTKIDGHLKKVNIEILSGNDEYSIVAGNINPGDIIVKNPNNNMKDGDPLPSTQIDNSKSDKN